MWRADCSRVTHPFAARVPRRALPLDLHVLSTPPAFVLSQDQTLQQKTSEQTVPAKNTRPHWQTKPGAPKETPRHHNHKSCSADEDKHTKHRHTVEFSKDNHTRFAATVSGRVPRGDSYATRSDPRPVPGGPPSVRPGL